MTAEELWYAWYGRDWRADAEAYMLPPDPEPQQVDTLDELEALLDADDETWDAYLNNHGWLGGS